MYTVFSKVRLEIRQRWKKAVLFCWPRMRFWLDHIGAPSLHTAHDLDRGVCSNIMPKARGPARRAAPQGAAAHQSAQGRTG